MNIVKNFFGVEQRAEDNAFIDTAEDIDLSLPSYDQNTRVTRQQALSVPAVASALFLISGIIAGIPIKLYRREEKKITEVSDDPRIKLLNVETNAVLGAFETKHSPC